MSNSRPVYSSEHGKLCAGCSKPLKGCICKSKQQERSGDGIARVRREVKGRRGKGVTTISGLPLNDAELKELGSELRRHFSTGGALKSGVIEIQGDHCEAVMAELKRRGFKAKRAGG